MKKLFNDYYISIKEKFNLESKMLLWEGIFLILISVICLTFNRFPKELTILYIFPISLILIAVKQLIYADKSKELEDRMWISIIIFGIMYLLFAFYLVINPLKDANQFIVVLSCLMIFIELTKLVTTKNKCLLNYLIIGIISLLSVLVIIFNGAVLSNLYLYLIISYLVLGVLKIISFFLLKKKNI